MRDSMADSLDETMEYMKYINTSHSETPKLTGDTGYKPQ